MSWDPEVAKLVEERDALRKENERLRRGRDELYAAWNRYRLGWLRTLRVARLTPCSERGCSARASTWDRGPVCGRHDRRKDR